MIARNARGGMVDSGRLEALQTSETGGQAALGRWLFWLASATLLYFSFSILRSAIFGMIVSNDYPRNVYDPVAIMHSVINCFSNLLFSIAFLCRANQSKFQPVS